MFGSWCLDIPPSILTYKNWCIVRTDNISVTFHSNKAHFWVVRRGGIRCILFEQGTHHGSRVNTEIWTRNHSLIRSSRSAICLVVNSILCKILNQCWHQYFWMGNMWRNTNLLPGTSDRAWDGAWAAGNPDLWSTLLGRWVTRGSKNAEGVRRALVCLYACAVCFPSSQEWDERAGMCQRKCGTSFI